MIPPIRVEDETTNKGAAKVILLLLNMFEILEVISQEGTNGDMKCLKLAADYRERHLMIVGDASYKMCARNFNTLIEETPYRFWTQHSERLMIQKEQNQVIHITGDLNGRYFCLILSIFTLYYFSIIQLIQALLGCKYIKGSDVTN